MSRRSFDESVRRALDSLPPEIARHLDNVAIVVEDEDPDDPDLVGVFREEPYLPAQIAIFRGPILRCCETRGEAVREIRDTVVHEVGHMLGLGDNEMPY